MKNIKEEDIRPKKIFNEFLRLAKLDIKKHFSIISDFVRINCPSCESSQTSVEFNKYGYNYETCQKCQTLFVNPRPNFDLIKSYYTNSESIKYLANNFYTATEDRRRKFIFRPRVILIKNIVRQNKIINLENYIDIGAGYGTFVEEITSLNLFKNVFALEPSEDFTDILRDKKINFINKSLEDLDENYFEKFDFATSFELLEHLFSAYEFMKKTNSILRKRGFLFFTTLNSQGFDMLVLGKKSKSISPPHHLNFFNLNSIQILLKRCNFNTVKVFTPGKLDVDIVKNLYDEKKLKLDKFISKIVNSDENTKYTFQKFLVNNNLSSHMCVLAQKQ